MTPKSFALNTSAALSLALGFAVAGTALAQDAGGGPGRTIFQERCGRCHGEQRMLRHLRTISEPERPAYLGRLFRDHYLPEAEERRVLANYLIQRTASRRGAEAPSGAPFVAATLR